MAGAGDFHFLTAAQHLQHGDLVSLRAKRLAGTPKYKPGYQVHRVLLVILLDQPSPADTKQLPLGPHHQAKLTPAQPLLAGYHGSTVTGHLLSNVARYGQFHRERLGRSNLE